MKRGKKYTEIKKTSPSQSMDIQEALKIIKKLSTSKFTGKIELHASLNINEKERKQNIRGSIIYSKPIGKAKKVLVFADPAGQEIAKQAGADYYGLEDLISKIKEGWMDFDITIATPSVMSKIAVLGKTLGTKGMMPSPKSGTVTDNIKGAIDGYKGGKVDFKSDNGVIHTIVGTNNSTENELNENFTKAIKSIILSSGKPERIALRTVFISPTMGPSIKINIDSIFKEDKEE